MERERESLGLPAPSNVHPSLRPHEARGFQAPDGGPGRQGPLPGRCGDLLRPAEYTGLTRAGSQAPGVPDVT